MTVDPVARGTGPDPRVEAEVRGAALGQLLAGGPLAESVHVVLVLVVAALVWNSMPLARTLGWVGAVTAAAALRTWWRLGLGRRAATPEQALRGVRLTVAGVGLAWGFGAAAAIPELGLDEAALILVVLAGIVAGATGALVGDRRSFRYLLVTVLAPLPVGILLLGHSRPHLLATLLIALFAWGMDRVQQRGYRTFADRVRAAVLLESSTQELARQHAYLDALIASTPVAIAVLDNQRTVRSVNPAFVTLFGYSATEVTGASIDGLIVPESLRSESGDLEARARSGEIVRVEVERRRKDGRHIQVRLSAAAVKAADEGARGPVRGYRRPQGGRASDARGARPGGAGGAGTQRVPRQHESRDPHPDERRARLRRAGARHRARAGAAARARAGALVVRGAAHHSQRHPRLLENRGGASRAGNDSVRPAQGGSCHGDAARGARARETSRAHRGRAARRPAPGAGRSYARAPGLDEPHRQRHQVHRGGRGRRLRRR